VLLRGESGTGKGLAARALHEESPRRSGPFVVIHCAALPETLLESELFGYEKGAFTGATTRKPGRVELGDGGTLFLDEIGDVPLAVQAKLLRVVQERTFERLGGGKTVRVDVRFVAATHRPLESMVEAGQFREDLFYRLNVVPLWLPPLRERPEDIEALARHFCAEYGTTSGRPDMTLEADAIALLRAQSWPGNVRQLQNLIERLTVLATRSSIGVTDVEHELGAGRRSSALSSSTMPSAGDPASLDARRRDAEREALVEALRRADDNRTVAARILGISRRTLYYKLKEHALA
jgi:two-component system response regulator AtoC